MTDEELKALLIERIGDPGTPSTDWEWWRQCLSAVRRCVEAKTLSAAEDVLRYAGWDDPRDGAIKLRGELVCPHCLGTGYTLK